MKGISLFRRLAAALLTLCVMMGCCGMAAAENAKYSATAKGFGGDVFVEIELDADGKIAAITIGDDKFAETPGLGARAQEDEFKAQFIGKSGQLALGSDIEAITGATVTSTAVVEAVNDALAQANPDSVPAAEEPAAEEKPAMEPWQEELANMYQRIADNQIKYAPKVTTLSNGVQIQRTPVDAKSYNNAVLKADSRGCAACHQDLAETLHNCSVFSNVNFDYHFDFRNEMGIETTIRQCYVCHVTGTYPRLSEIMHGIHSTSAFQAVGGNCWSCHASDPATGNIEQWDLVKYQKLKGITEVANVQGEFSIDQDKVSESFWQLNWMYNDADTERVARAFSGMVPNPEEDGIYDEWTISVAGEVADPKEYTLAELIEIAPSVTKKSASSCVINPNGGPFIANVEITGIPVTWLLEQAGVNEGCDVYYIGNYGQRISDLEKHQGYLVYQVNGEPVPYANGYPCVFWFEGSTAADCRKAAHQITVSSVSYEDSNPTWIRQAAYGPFAGDYDNVPLVAITHFTDGQIIPDEPYTFEGYAFGFRDRVEANEENNNPLFNEDQDPCSIAAIEISMDQGKTWTRCETPDATSDRWTYWYFTWTPETEGSYVISVRSVRNDGMVSHPIEKLFNVQ